MVCHINILILKIRKLSNREVISLSHDHRDGYKLNQDLNIGSLAPHLHS